MDEQESQKNRTDYSDAHYEPEEESTVPPRYYAPPKKAARDPKENKLPEMRFSAVLFVVLVAAVLGGLIGVAVTDTRLGNRMDDLQIRLEALEAERQEAQAMTEAMLEELPIPEEQKSESMSPPEIYELAKQQVVGIRTEITVTNFFGMTSSGAVSGSGLILSSDGYILTNYHVVEDAYLRQLDVQVILYDGTEFSAVIAGVEPGNDIAILKIEAEGLTPAMLGDSSALKVGEEIYAIGNPLGELQFSMSTGHVSALDRVIDTQEGEAVNMFQIDAAVNEGNSGGPVYNGRGEVIGIVTAKYSSSGVEGLGFAIPSNDARPIAEDLITKGYVTGKAYMGVSLDNRYNSMYSQYYGTPLGAYVSEVTPGSSADLAGVKAGDIITAIGEHVIQDYSELKSALKHYSAFETTDLTVYRRGEEIHLTITFDEMKPE